MPDSAPPPRTAPSSTDPVFTIPAPAGAALIEAVAVMDRLRAPGGCPWDAEQTHVSLVRYLVEECFELVQAIEDGDEAAIREELGDVLLQVLFHARIAAERTAGFDIDDVAGDLVDKLVRRHPHVFADAGVLTDAAEQQQRWDELKKAEKGRGGPLAGVAMAAPSMQLAGKLGARAHKFGAHADLPDGAGWAEEVFRLAYAAGAAGEDPEIAVRAVARAHADRMRELPADPG